MVERLKAPKKEVRIAAVGKYIDHDDAYKSINEAFVHAGIANDCAVVKEWVDSEVLETCDSVEDMLSGFDGKSGSGMWTLENSFTIMIHTTLIRAVIPPIPFTSIFEISKLIITTCHYYRPTTVLTVNIIIYSSRRATTFWFHRTSP